MHQSLEEYEFQLFKWHVKETDTLIDKMIKDETSYIKNQTDTGDTEQDDSGMVAAEYYMCRVRYSHVIHLASLFESMLKGECDRLAQAIGENNLLFKLSELKGEPWLVKRRFIERYGQFEVPDEIWQPAEDLLKVRNVVIHANGAIDSRQPDQKRAIEKQPGISNLLQILALFTDQTLDMVAQQYQGQTSYGDLKKAVAEATETFLENFQASYRQVDMSTLQAKLEASEAKMNEIANQTLLRVQKAIGLR